jgi:glycosyltransferase involved in cell wall biosynthesis
MIMRQKASIIIRTYNEDKHLNELLKAIAAQKTDNLDIETVLVDSGSTDATLEIARNHNCKILHISKDEFTFGRSLNIGCEGAEGDFLIFISGHCIPVNERWLQEIVSPLAENKAAYSYGRQIGNGDSKFSECQLLNKYFPDSSKIPQHGFFVNNANSALKRSIWERFRFDEELTGLEDMELGKRLVSNGFNIAYVSESSVYHLHEESWAKVKNRYLRESIALQQIMPEVHVNFPDFLRYFFSGVFFDISAAIQEKCLISKLPEIIMFRLMQYWGSYRGNHEHRKLSKKMKERYFYPK